MPRPMPAICSAFLRSTSGFSKRLDLEIDEALGARRYLVARGTGELLIGQQHKARLQRLVARDKRADRCTDPAQSAVRTQRNVAIGRGAEAFGPRLEFGCERLLGCRTHGLGILAAGALVGGEAEPLQLADMVAFDEDGSGWADFGFRHRIFSKAPHEDGSPAVYEAFRQPLMQRIRQSVFDFARLFLPVCLIGQPAGPVGNESPGADLGNPVRQRVDVAFGRVGAADLLGHVVLIDMAMPGKVHIDRGDEVGMLGRRDLPVVGQSAASHNSATRLASVASARMSSSRDKMLERLRVDRRQCPRQAFDRRVGLDRALERVEAGEIEMGGAPLQHLDRVEIMPFDLLDQLFVQWIDLAGDAEGAVAQMPAGAAGDLAQAPPPSGCEIDSRRICGSGRRRHGRDRG